MSPAASLLLACAVIALLSIPLILGIVPPNRWYGFRTRGTLSDRALWYRANRVAGAALLAAAIVCASIVAFAPAVAEMYGALVLILPVAAALAVSLFYLRRAARD